MPKIGKTKTAWDLSPLYRRDSDPRIERDRKTLRRQVASFIKKWRGRNDYKSSATVLKRALDDYERWMRSFGSSGAEGYYFALRHAQNENNPKIKAKVSKITDFANEIWNEMQFFTLNLGKIEPKVQKKFLKSSSLKPYRAFLAYQFAWSAHNLSVSEEKIINLKSKAAYDLWVSMTSAFLTKETREVLTEKGKKTIGFAEMVSLAGNRDKKIRDNAAKALNDVLAKNADTAEYELNAILDDKKVNDELRNFVRPDGTRHLSDGIASADVDTLTKVVSGRFEIAKRYYRLKAELLKVPKLAYHERTVEYASIDKKYSFAAAADLVERSFANLDPEFAEIFRRFLAGGRVDVYPGKGKHDGAFCNYNLITQPVFVLLNHTDRLRDVLTLAHEFGHAINYEFVRKHQHALYFGTSLATAEVASTFMEDFVLDEILAEADDETKLAVMMQKLDGDISSIFRQVACYKFETDLHRAYRERGYLSKQEIGQIFQKNMRAYMGPAVEQSAGSENWWVYWSHIRVFFYVYSYASGLLISKYLQAEVRANKKFIQKVKSFLSAGISASPKEIFARTGINISRGTFWQKGLDEVEDLLEETEKLARKLGLY